MNMATLTARMLARSPDAKCLRVGTVSVMVPLDDRQEMIDDGAGGGIKVSEKAVLVAEMEDGRVVAGETAVASERRAVRRLRLQPEAPQAHPEAVAALASADLIVLGPGSLFTSTIPPLLVPGLADAVP